MDRLYDDRLHRLIAEDFFRQRWDQLEEKRSQLSRDLARHQHAEGAYMELGSKLIELIAQAPQIFERADSAQRRELLGLLASNRVLKGRELEFELRKPFDALVSAANRENGWGGRIRTYGGGSKGRRSTFVEDRGGSFRIQISQASSAGGRRNSRKSIRVAVKVAVRRSP